MTNKIMTWIFFLLAIISLFVSVDYGIFFILCSTLMELDSIRILIADGE